MFKLFNRFKYLNKLNKLNKNWLILHRNTLFVCSFCSFANKREHVHVFTLQIYEHREQP